MRAASIGTPGLFVPVAPYRTYDSRESEAGALLSLANDAGSGLALNILSVEEDGERVLAIPETATAITYNVTIVNQTSSGFLTVASVSQPPAAAIASSTVNWNSAGGPIANGSAVVVGEFDGEPGFVGIVVGGPVDASTDFIIDVTGYYVAGPRRRRPSRLSSLRR